MVAEVVDTRITLLGDCASCPLFIDDTYKQLVRGYGVADRLMVVGEAPGASEVSQGRPFVGESGRLIRKVLKQLGIDPEEDVYWTNADLCRPAANKTPNPTAIKACNDRLFTEIAMVKPVKILALGGIALSAIKRTPAGIPITKNHGQGFYVDYEGGRAYTVATYHPSAVMRDLDLFRDFGRDIEKLLTTDQPFGDIPITTIVPEVGTMALDGLRVMMKGTDLLTCDLETTGLNPLANQTISIGFGAIGEKSSPAIIIPVSILTDLDRDQLYEMMSDYEGELVFHNAGFDLQFLDVYFGQALRPKKLRDSMILHYGLDERPIGRYAAHGLKDLSRIYYDIDDYRFDFNSFYGKMSEKGISVEELGKAYTELYEYQAKDCVYTAMLFRDLMAELEVESPETQKLLEEVLYPGVQAFAETRLYGARIDIPYLKKKRGEYVELLNEKLAELRELAGPDFAEFNPMSPIQVQKLFFDVWGLDSSHGKSTEREALDSLIKRTKNPDYVDGIRKVIEYRLRGKVLATYIDGMLNRVDHDGRLRTDIRIAGTSTGRLSSSDPNLQNIPTLMGPEIRNAFIATDGYKFVECDYSQLELRVAALFSKDVNMLQTFRDGRDIHVTVAAKMFRKPEEQVTEYERYLAKYVDFGVIYGRQARSLAEGWEMDYLEEKLGGKRWSLAEAEHFLAEFLNGFPQLTKWMRQQQELGLRQQYVSSPMGRRRRFPFVTDALRSHIGRQAVNTPIQGFASDICLTSLIKLHNTLPDGANVLFPVHDAIYFEVREDLLEEVIPQIRAGMETNLPHNIEREVPFPIKVKVGERWGTVVEVK